MGMPVRLGDFMMHCPPSPQPWRPPLWWNVGSDLNNPSYHRLIRSAHAKAKKCTKCKNLSWPPGGVSHYLRDFQLSAQRGCAGCLILCGIIELICSHTDGLEIKVSIKQSRTALISFDYKTYEAYSLHAQNYGCRIPHLPRKLEVSLYSGSGYAIRRTQSWLRDCEKTHKSCSHTGSSLPSRVLVIQGSEDVKLYETKGETAPYTCLSHCWGKMQILRTTRSTLPHYKQKILWKQLPLTFQHAISFTYRLGIKYLWIDSLCIIQDDVQDWRHEGSRMAQIYSGAYLTLAATASQDASGGCFRQTPERSLLHLSYPDMQGFRSDLCIRPQIKNDDWASGKEPLLLRTWTLQELLLSPRILHFTNTELVWECRTKSHCECSSSGTHLNQRTCNPSWLNHEISIAKGKVEPHVWWRLVERYSRQSLTYEKDVFPALQGISKIFSKHKKSRYLAGLWEDSLIQDLLWVSTVSTRPKDWRAPSWSWASVLGYVYWDFSNGDVFTTLATLTVAETELSGMDTFGEILSANIILRTRCLDQETQSLWLWRIGTIAEDGDDPYGLSHPIPGISIDIDYKTGDFDGETWRSEAYKPGTRIKTIIIGHKISKHRGESPSYMFLMVRKCNRDDDKYERIARMEVFCCENIEYYLSREEESFCIV